MKKGFVFTMDIFVGLVLVIAILLTFNFFQSDLDYQVEKYQKLNYKSEDVINVLSNLKVQEIQNTPTIQQLISQGDLEGEDLEKSVIDISTSLFYSGNESLAADVLEDVLQNISDVCLEVFTSNQTVYQSCIKSDEDDYSVSTIIETGYEIGRPSDGYTSRAFLSSISSKKTNSYVYFGGYIGNGNITRIMNISFDDIQEVYMEMDVGTNFSLYINDNFAGNYNKGSAGGGNMTADKWYIDSSYHQYFQQGENKLDFNFTGENAYIGGGHFRLTYETSELSGVDEAGTDRYFFPGIYGLINLYSSFYVPGNLTNMSVHLHYKNNYTTYLVIGNETVFSDTKEDEQIVDINDSTLSDALDYDKLSINTVPIRLGTESTAIVGQGNADIVLITDTSGSMNYRLEGGGSAGQSRDCDDPDLYDPKTKRISLARCLDKEFIDIILQHPGNRVGLIGYAGNPNNMCTGDIEMIELDHNLSTDKDSLYDDIDTYNTQGATGICGSLRRARVILDEQGDPSKQKFIVIMTDGLANVDCDPNNENSTKGCIPNKCPFSWSCECFGTEDCLHLECGEWVSNISSNNSVDEACKAHEDTDATIYSIGFGPVADCESSNQTLQKIAECGNGSYYVSSDAYELEEIYQNIAEEIVEITYETQIINVTGDASYDNVLYPDSYIEFNYTPLVIPYDYGEISFTRETDRLGDQTGDDIDKPYKEGWFNISERIKVVDAKITSYSSNYWTDRLYVKNENDTDWTTSYWLGDYGNDYTTLGDPYIVQIPVDKIGTGNNSVRIGTGLSPLNATGGSPDDRVIFTGRVKGSVGYGDVFNNSEDAVDDAIGRLINVTKDYINITEDDIVMENQILGGIRWLWGPSLVKIVVWEK